MKNLTIKKKLYLLAFIIGSFFIGLNIMLYNNASDVKSKWDDYNKNINLKMNLLSHIKNDFGYGGSIHHFKNYILRGDERYVTKFEKSYDKFIERVNNYLKIKDLSKLEKKALFTIAQTFEKYKINLLEAMELKTKGLDIKTIDKALKIDDNSAIKAMRDLENYYDRQNKITSNSIYSTIYDTYYFSLTAIISLTLLIGFLGIFFEKNIINPLKKVETGLDNFFKFLNKELDEITPIELTNKDEFGMMAQNTNNHIITASKLHQNMENKNTELLNLINSFSENVIASRTNKNGTITYVTKAFEEISGFSSEELLNRSHNLVRHPDMPKSAFKDMWNTIKEGETWKGEVKNLKKDGGYYWVNAVIKPIYDHNGDIEGYSSVREDITNRKKVEELNRELNTYKNHLEDKVTDATKEIMDLNKEIEETQKEVVFTMGAIGESRSKETGNHVKRVAEYSKLFALKYGMDEKEADLLKQASPMHDIGKVAIPDSILKKPGKLTDEEFKLMQTHCCTGYEMLKNSTRPLLKTAAIVCAQHHEKYNGKGYPNGLKGEEIHIYGRITAIADVFDALGSDRCYKKAWSDEQIFKLFKEERGNHFDPKLVDIFFDNLDQFLDIRERLKEI